ncbi:MAG: LPS assembly lipoprotein LptE [Planctomycetota bacterium]|nr:LPS assembly lipoprotein LptE [Planctomycetota bacterium]
MRFFAILFLCLLPSGCGFESGGDSGGYHWGSLYRQDIHTVAVPIFSSRDFHRGVEFQLSEALVKKIEAFTPYKVVPRERADTVLEGEIVSIQPVTLALDPRTATPQQQLYSIVVNFTWKDLHTGKVLMSREGFAQTTTFYPILGEGQFVGSQNSVEKLALGIVEEMEAAW